MNSPDGQPVIYVVDDEAPFRRSLLFLLESMGWDAVGHESAEAFLAAQPPFPLGGGCRGQSCYLGDWIGRCNIGHETKTC